MVNLRKITPRNKKGVSAIIGYVLLITFGIILSVIVYNYLKTYVPKDLIDCPDGSSIFVKDYSCSDGILNLTLKNNGRFNLAGYYIHYSNNSDQEIATRNMAGNFKNTGSTNSTSISGAYILFDFMNENSMSAGKEFVHSFNYTQAPAFIEITPVRFETYEEKIRFASCGNARVKEAIICS